MTKRGASFRTAVLGVVGVLGVCGAVQAQTADPYTNLGINGGMVEDIAFVPGTPGAVFAATYEGAGVYRSSDSGAAWSPVAVDNDAGPADTFRNNDVFQIAVAPSDPQVLYVVHNDWVDVSTDGGATWINVLNATMQRDCTDCGGAEDDLRLCQTVAVDPTDPATAYVGTVGPNDTYVGGAIYKTTDTGVTWRKLNGGADFDFAVKSLVIDPQVPGTVWAVTSSEGKAGWGGSLYRSGDGGASWTSVFSLTPYGSSFFDVAVKPNDSNTVFTGSGFGVLKHVFAEGTWALVNDNATRLAYDLAFDPQDPETLYATWIWPIGWGGDGIGKVSRTIDGGNTWEVFPHDHEFNTLAVDPHDSEVLLAGDFTNGVFRSTDHGQTWTPSGDGVSAVTVYDVAVDPQDTGHVLAGTASALFERVTPDAPWQSILDTSIRAIAFDPADSRTIYAGTRRHGLGRTADGGQNWNATAVPGPSGAGDNDVVAIAVDPQNPSRLFLAVYGHTDSYGQVYRSTDGGQTLEKVLDGVNGAGESYPFNAVAIDPFDSNHVFAGGGRFYPPKVLGDLWESTDGGDTWARTGLVDDTEDTAGVIVNALAMHPTRQGVLYAGTGFSSESFHPLYASSDGGTSWTPQHEGIVINSYNAVKDLAFHRENPDILYAATLFRGIYISPNRGADWRNLGTPGNNVRAIAVGSLYGATEGGLYQLTGTGCIFGNVADQTTEAPIDGADVFTGADVHSPTVAGEYILIAPAGVHDVTATAAGYADATHGDVTLPGGGAVQSDFALQAGIYAVEVGDSAAPTDDRVLSFGNVAAGDTAEIVISLTNTGDATFTVGSIGDAGVLPAPFTLADDTCTGTPVGPSETCTFRVHFSPDDDTGAVTTFAVVYGDAPGDAVTVQVYGNTNTLAAPTLIWPEPDTTTPGTTVDFAWTESGEEPAPGHYLYCSTDPQFTDAAPYTVAAVVTAGLSLAGAGLSVFLLGATLPGTPRRRRRNLLFAAAALCATASLFACAGSTGPPPDRQVSRTVTGLDANTTYYWKVVLDDGVGGHVESETRSFTTP